MLVVTLEIVLLLGIIILPLKPAKRAVVRKLNPDTDTRNAIYAINDRGVLERINKPYTKQLH